MRNELYIDEKDAYLEYGVYIAENAYNDIVSLPALKPIAYNDWHEKNGIDPDLTSPVLAAHDITIDFYIVGYLKAYNDFMQTLSDGAFHTFMFNTIGLTKNLRLVKCSEVKTVQDMHKFSLTFSDDNPFDEYEYYGPTSALLPYYDYFIDDKDVSDYGIRILQGTYDDIIRQPDVKENLKRNIQSVSGQYYDGKNVTYKTRTVGLKCLMRTRSLTEFWQNRNALLYDLIRPGARILKVASIDKEIPFYYKSCSVDAFHPDEGKVWFEFTLNVEFFNGVI